MNNNGMQILQSLAHRAHRASIEGGAEVGVQGGWSGYDVIGGHRGDVGSAGLVDIIGAVETLQSLSMAQRPSLARMATASAVQAQQEKQQYAHPVALQAARVMQQPLGLPPNAVMVEDSPGVSRKQYVGLGARVAIPIGGGVDIQAQPQSISRIERLIIESIGTPTASGRDFVVSRVDIGDVRQLSGQGEIPGLAFSSEGFQLDVKLDTSNPGNVITISIENVSAGAITIALCGIGTVVR